MARVTVHYQQVKVCGVSQVATQPGNNDDNAEVNRMIMTEVQIYDTAE